MKSEDVAYIFGEIAKILDLKEENPFRIRAYVRAAQNIESLGKQLDVFVKEDRLTEIGGIGTDLANKIKEIVASGRLKYYEELKKEIPEGVIRMLEIPGLGPKTVKLIYRKLKIDTIEKLEKAASRGILRKLEGIREKTESNILRGIQFLKKGQERTPLYLALNIAKYFIEGLKNTKAVEEIEVAGSLRRRKETIRDIDILAISNNPEAVMEKFVSLEGIKEILAKGETKSSVISKEDIQVDLRVLPRRSFGAALLYFTGSKEFNIKLRQLATKLGYKINEYGIFKENKRIAGKTEEEIFSLMKMAYIPSELREDRGEIEAALKNTLPKIIALKDIRGDLHVHSKYSDGAATLQEIYKEAQKFGYQYVGVCDHSQSLKIAGGVSVKEVYRKIEEIRRINKKGKVKLLCGTEVDIASDGRLDYPDSVLKEFDLVIAAIHSGFKQKKEQLTKRVVSACKNKYVNVIAHPTARLWGTRDAYEIDLDEIIKVAGDYKVALEINAHPQRLDLNDVNSLAAKNKGVKLSLGTDTHLLSGISAMELGLSVARRAWLTKHDILNGMGLEKLSKWLKK